MARTVKTTKTPEQRRAEAEQLHITITEQVEALRESEAWTRFLVFSRAFHCYSLSNLLLALGQAPEASHVVGYRRWQALNRQVRQGERGIRTFGGLEVRQTAENPKTGQEWEQRRTRFFPVSVFDISQTDLTDQEAGDPADVARPLMGEDSAGISIAVADYHTGKGWSVERKGIAGGVPRTQGRARRGLGRSGTAANDAGDSVARDAGYGFRVGGCSCSSPLVVTVAKLPSRAAMNEA